jgi:hypothetical protein
MTLPFESMWASQAMAQGPTAPAFGVVRTNSHSAPSPRKKTSMSTVDRRIRSRADSGRRRLARRVDGFMS